MPKVRVNNNIVCYYELHGRGYPLLLLAGLSSDNASWAGVYGKLAKNFQVVLFDNRGSGRSSVPDKKYSIRDMAEDAIRLLDRLQIERCHVIGNSMGGYIAQELAIRYPVRIGKLILESTAAVSSVRNNLLFRDFLRRFEKDHDKEALMRLWVYWLFSPETFKRKDYIERFIDMASAYPYLQTAGGFRGQVDAIVSFDASSRIKNIKAKTLVIAGTDDILIYPAESKKLAKGIRGSVFKEIKNIGHCAHVEDPDIFISEVMRFLR